MSEWICTQLVATGFPQTSAQCGSLSIKFDQEKVVFFTRSGVLRCGFTEHSVLVELQNYWGTQRESKQSGKTRNESTTNPTTKNQAYVDKWKSHGLRVSADFEQRKLTVKSFSLDRRKIWIQLRGRVTWCWRLLETKISMFWKVCFFRDKQKYMNLSLILWAIWNWGKSAQSSASVRWQSQAWVNSEEVHPEKRQSATILSRKMNGFRMTVRTLTYQSSVSSDSRTISGICSTEGNCGEKKYCGSSASHSTKNDDRHQACRRMYNPMFSPRSPLDFGCPHNHELKQQSPRSP